MKYQLTLYMLNRAIHNKKANYLIKIINSLDTHIVRHPVLRKGKPIESCIFSGDDLDTTIHLGLFLNKKLIGVCTFLKRNHNLLSVTPQFQLRGMAILEGFQDNGFGNIILNYGESLLKKENTKIVWCNARKVAVNFYKKNGYQTIGEPFNIENIGLHYIMYKTL
mgnify:CR=1 FL=1